MKNVFAILLILAAIGIFFGYIKPMMGTVSEQKKELAVQEETLKQAEELEAKIKSLQEKIDRLDPSSMARLEKLVPDTLRDVELLNDVNTIVSRANLKMRNIKIEQSSSAQAADRGGAKSEVSSSEFYDSVDLTFDVTASYGGFLGLISSIERSLRIFDIVNISFTPTEAGDAYNFKVVLRSYWLK